MQMILAWLTLLSAALICARCQQQFPAGRPDVGVIGYMYTSLNGEGENQVISFARAANGSLLSQTAYPTGSLGGANRSAFGMFTGGFDAQESMRIIEDSLLVVNVGGATISVFKLDRATGNLKLARNFDSRGMRPVSLAVHPVARQKGLYWVVVGNQFGNPQVQLGGSGQGPTLFFPDKQFITKGRFALNLDRNIYLFLFYARTRVLKPLRRIDAYVGTNGGPACVAFSPDGSKLAVSTWGIPRLFVPPSEVGPFMQPSRVYVYDFNPRTGRFSGKRFFEDAGVAGTTGFSWNPGRGGGRDLLYVSNFGLTQAKIEFGVTVLDASPPRASRHRYGAPTVSLVQNFGGGAPNTTAAECWTWVNRDGSLLWVTGTAPNIVSTFKIDPRDGRLSILGPGPRTSFVQRPDAPGGDSKDLWQTPDGKFLYMLGSFESFQVVQFDIDGPSLSFVTQTTVPAAQPRERGAFNFLGLAGFDLRSGRGRR